MAILVKLDDLLHDRRMTLTELAERVDLTLANLSILKTGKARAICFSRLRQSAKCSRASRATYWNLDTIPAPESARACHLMRLEI
jgi:hypothetical protein